VPTEQASVAPPVNAAASRVVTDPAYIKLRDIIYRISGIYHPENKLYLLAERCARRMQALSVKTPAEYVDHLTIRPNREAELRQLLNEITIGETSMFRSAPQIDALRRVILPQIVEAKSKLGYRKLRLWSAGCSTGEEPYTLAMVLLEEAQAALKGWSFEIAATDLNERSIETAKAGVFGDYGLRNTSEYYKNRYMQPEGKGFRVKDEVTALIAFSRLNLQDDSKMLFMKGMDIIFCCNVLIYFDGVSKSRVIHHFYNNLLPGGYLLLGTSESLFQVNDQFRLVHFPGATAYWKQPLTAAGGAR
jgi:chemotaxis protein methyltransferase CheR